jgi:hypothetical protein
MSATQERVFHCQHKCHEIGLNPWVKECPVCGCPDEKYDPKAQVPDWLQSMSESYTHER